MTNTLQEPTNTRNDGASDANWWRQAVVYQVYPRSFADANGDGIGDLAGLISRVDYLQSLGVDAVWLSPFYPSALADGGYDVDDHRDVDPRIGTLAEFDRMTEALHTAGIKVVVDIVPNHSSNRHVWFREALESPRGSAARERYIFRDGTGRDGAQPPTDWESIFGGPAWTRVADGQWYLHLFAPEQPDFNWDNRAVRDEFLLTLKFWADRGVDGFRIDVANALVKDLAEPLPSHAELKGELPIDGSHRLFDRDAVHEVYAEWRRLFNEYDPPRTAVAEAWVPAERRARYASPDGLGQAFNFDLLRAEWDAQQFRTIIEKNLTEAEHSGASSTWVFSNHDVVRHASRYGLPIGTDEKAWLLTDGVLPASDPAKGLRRARAVTLLGLALPGSAYLYQGEELGLPEVADLAGEVLQDPTWLRSAGAEKGRDGCRVPLPWTMEGASFGFGPGGAHLPQPAWFAAYSVEAQEGDAESTLSFYRAALAARRVLQSGETLRWLDAEGTDRGTDRGTGGGIGISSGTSIGGIAAVGVGAIDADVVRFERPGGWVSVTNFGATPVPLPVGRVVLSSGPVGTDLPPDTTVWLVVGEQ